MNRITVTVKRFGEIVRNHFASARVKYDNDWNNAYMFGGQLPIRPNRKVIEATLKLGYAIKG